MAILPFNGFDCCFIDFTIQMILQVSVLHIFIYKEPVFAICTVANQRYQIWMVESTQYIHLHTKFSFSVSLFERRQIHLLDRNNLQIAKGSKIIHMFHL